MKNVFFLLILLNYLPLKAQKCHCDSTFTIVRIAVEKNYAGWFDKTKNFNAADFMAFEAKISNRCRKISDAKDCAHTISDWTKYFNDKNLTIKYLDVLASKTAGKNISLQDDAPKIKVLVCNLKVKGCMDYLRTAKTLSKIEGVWENESYKIAIIKSAEKPKTFTGVIISSVYENWQADEIKFEITEKRSGEFSIDLIMRDKEKRITPDLILKDDILDANPLFLKRIFPTTNEDFDFEEYVNKNAYYSIATSKIKFLSDNLAVIKIPDFKTENNTLLLRAIQKNRERLANTHYLIIDLRGNSGGNIDVVKSLFPFLYTKRIVWFNCKHRATAENYDKWFSAYVKPFYNQSSEKERKIFDSTEIIVKKQFGGFHNFYNENQIADTFLFNKIMPSPKKIGVLINDRTISGGELFAMLARQSDKVVMYGQKSYGLLDYGRNVDYATNCPQILVSLPTLRYNWLDYGISVDRDKVKPDVLISENNDDWIKTAYKDLLKRENQ